MNYLRFVLIFLVCVSYFSFPQSIEILKKNATVWAREQTINGKLIGFFEPNITLNLNGSSINSSVNSSDSSFSIPVILSEGLSEIMVNAGTIVSDTLKLILGYNIRPEVFAYANVNGRDVTLRGSVIENPDTSSLTFLWTEDINNPSPVIITNSNDTISTFSLPTGAPLGEYYFNLYTYSSKGDTVKSRTFVTVDSNEVKAFDIKNDYAAWIDSAIIYEITPYIFANGNQHNDNDFNSIKNKIPDFVRLGVNTIWLQPVYSTYGGGQGYDITNYFSVRPDLGTEEELGELIQTAKEAGLKVMFDFVPNHSSIRHPYAQNTVLYKDTSHYYNFYLREFDNADYSQHYNLHPQGFIYYFWTDLPIINHDNPEAQKWLIEAAKHWIEKFDIDGYRFDAVWGMNARTPDFAKKLRLAIKRIKPEFLMLAEDKATNPETFDENFDVAYDWYPEESWVSHWVWQYDFDPNSNPTIFNSGGVNNRSSMLRNSLTNNGNGFAPDAKILRFLENNDIFPFIQHHGLERTKMAAALLFSLDGIPLIYNGQEIGKEDHPYETEYIFYPGFPLDYSDQFNLFEYYQRLIELRKLLPALTSDNFEEVDVNPGNYIYGYRRWVENQNVFGLINMAGSATSVNISLPVEEMNLDSAAIYYLTDMISGEIISGLPEDFENKSLSVAGYTTRLFLFADSAMTVTGINDYAETEIPQKFEVAQNYPNPFNPSTVIKYNLPREGQISVKIFDILGREVASLVNEIQKAGSYNIRFDASNLSSGVYIYRFEFENLSYSKKMILIK